MIVHNYEFRMEWLEAEDGTIMEFDDVAKKWQGR